MTVLTRDPVSIDMSDIEDVIKQEVDRTLVSALNGDCAHSSQTAHDGKMRQIGSLLAVLVVKECLPIMGNKERTYEKLSSQRRPEEEKLRVILREEIVDNNRDIYELINYINIRFGYLLANGRHTAYCFWVRPEGDFFIVELVSRVKLVDLARHI